MTAGARVGLIGLGAMGGPLARLFREAGYELAVYDPRLEAVAPFGDAACASPRAVADRAELVLASLPTPDVVREVGLEVAGGDAIRIFVDLSTTGAVTAEEVAAALAERGVGYVDAPVSGGVAGLEARTLAVMASGERAAFDEVRPLFDVFAANVFWVGERPGQGQTAKLLNNLLSATAMAITSEALQVGRRAGLDPATLLEVFNAGSGRNTATSDKFPKHVLTRGFGSGFRLQLMTKDVRLALAEAERRGVAMPVGDTVRDVWTTAGARCDAAADHTEIVRLYEDWGG